MNWNEGHPEHWRNEIEAAGYAKPPETHVYAGNHPHSCIYCGHTVTGESLNGVCVE